MKEAPYTYQTTGRNWPTALTVLGLWATMAAAVVWLDAALWIIWVLALFTLPALIDLATARTSKLELTDTAITWVSGRREGHIDLDRIDHIRLDTRLDMSVRASAVMPSGRKDRLPLDVVPPHRDFEAALTARGVTVKRHHFSLVG